MAPFPGNSIDFSSDLVQIMDVTARWSSTYYFLRRAIKLRRPIDEIAAGQELRVNELCWHDWGILQDICGILEEFAEITSYIEAVPKRKYFFLNV